MDKIIEQGMLGQDCQGQTIRYIVPEGAEPGRAQLKVEGFRTPEINGLPEDIRLTLKGFREGAKLWAGASCIDG